MLNDFLEVGIQPKGKSVKQKLVCPKCSPTRKNKHDKSLSIDLLKGLYNCHNCGWKGNVKIKEKVEFTVPVENKVELSDEIIDYFASRSISKDTLANWNITESVEFFGQTGGKKRAINFNYYRDGKLINVKYRDNDKNFKLVSGAELIFYGLDNIKEVDVCYITEGEIDALSFNECGIYSVCSVPNGATKGSQGLKYLDNCYEYFKEKKKIVICTDNDSAGLNLRHELARRFGQYRCQYLDYGVYKDANEVLVEEGREALREIIMNPLDFPVEGILDIDVIWDSVLNWEKDGVKNYSVGLGADDYFKVMMGEWSVITGIPNSGKSDVLDQICVNLALMHDHKIAMFSPESYPYEGHIRRIANKINSTECDTDMLNHTKNFIEEHFFFIKIDVENITLQNIIDRFTELVFKKGINVCVIDPWNLLQHDQQYDLSYISKMLGFITQFCQKTNTHLFLVAHPRKMDSYNGVYSVPTPYHISGSSDFFNKAYNCITVYRRLGERTRFGSDQVEVHVQKVKRMENGTQGAFRIAPDFTNGGFYRTLDETNRIITIEK